MFNITNEIRLVIPDKKRHFTFKSIYAILLTLLLNVNGILGQSVIARQDFESSPASPTMTYSVSGSGGTAVVTSGQSGTSGSNAPATTDLFSEGTQGYRTAGTTRTITFSAVNTSGHTGISFSIRLASFSIGSNANGADAGDNATVQVSPDNGTTWYTRVVVAGNTNARWSFASGTGNASNTYAANNTSSNYAPSAGGARTTDGYSTISISSLPQVTQLMVRIVLLNDNSNETWIIDDARITGTVAATPSIAFSSPAIPTSNINNNSTNNIIGAAQLDVTTSNVILNSVTFTTAGTYTTGDIASNGFKFWLSSSATDISGATQLGSAQAAATNGSNITVSGLSNSISSGTTRYIVLTADIAVSPTNSATIGISSTAFTNITLASGTKTGTDPIAAGTTRSISVSTPNISIVGNHPISSNINQNTTNQVFGSIALEVTNANATLNSITFTTSGTYQTSDLESSSFKLFYTTSNTFASSVQLGSSQAVVASGNTVIFSGLSQVINSGTTGYLWITCDVAYNATSGRTISIHSTSFSDISFSNGNKSGTDPVSASNSMTISTVTPSIAIAFIGPSAGVADIPSTSLILHQFSMATTLNSADLNSITATLGGTYTAADLNSNSFKLWYNTFNTFGTATQIGSSQAIVSTGNTITFSSLAQKLNIGTTGYFWITADVSGSATNGNTIFIDANAFSNIVFSNASKTGTDPINAGGTKTLTTQVAAGSIVINQFSADYGAAGDEFIELVNLTNQAIDLSSLKLNYLSNSGGGTYSSALSGTIPANGFWLLSPNATVSVGLTSLSRDGSFTAGFSTAGQIAIRRNSDNTIIDGIAYGSVSSNLYGEGTSATAAPTDGAIKRITDGADAGANNTDFTTVSNASIYLRNSGSRLGISGSVISSGTFRDLTITGNSSLSGTVNITNKVEVISGTLTTNNNLILKSDATGTASIGNSSGTISGNVTVERFIPRRRAFRFLASPVNTSNFISGSWQQATHITGSLTGQNGFDQSNSGTASLFTYNVSGTEGWAAIPNTNSTNLNIGTGYRMLIRGDRNINLNTTTPQDSAALVLSATGTIVTGNVVFGAGSVSSSPAGIPALNAAIGSGANNSTVGWSLIGNPYACAVNWTSVTKSNVSNTFATWNVNNAGRGSYVYHNGTTGTGTGASNIINSGQSIFVQTTAANPSITFTEASKVSSTPPSHFKKSLSDVLNIDIFIGDRAYDGLAVMFDENCNNQYDVQDFIKLVNPEINFYSYLADGTKLAMNNLKEIGTETIVPLGLTGVFNGGSYELKFTNQNTFANADLILKDKFINKTYDLKSINNLTFTVTADSNSFGENRFELVFSKSATGLNSELTSNNNFIVFPNPANNVLNLSLTTSKEDNYSYSIFNQLGAEVSNGQLDFNSKRTHTLNIENLSNGVYFIQVKNGKTAQTIKFIK